MDFLDEKISLPIQGVSIDWNKVDGGSYLREIEALKGLDYLSFNKKITIFVGENGSGKSTMLEAIAVNYGFNPEGGTKNYSFSTYDSHSELCDAIQKKSTENLKQLRSPIILMLPVLRTTLISE